jgi:ATP-dependent Clp protease ATP-binding subunit ClpC
MSEESKNQEKTILENYSIDLTKLAEEGKLDPVVGREKEIKRISQILSRRKKNNPVLIGDPGVGKSSIGDGIAQLIIDKKVPRTLYDKKIISLDLGSMVAGTKYRGQFEERVKSLVDELKNRNDIILFIDEIHTIVGAGGTSGSLDAANMLKPALARGEVQVIGATTLDEYRKVIEKDGALERRFQKIIINETTVEETIEILNNIKARYEDHHNVKYTKEAIDACVKLTDRYITDRFLPDKAVDALDEVGSKTQISQEIPKFILDIEKDINDVKNDKMKSVKDQDFEKAADFRDKEKELLDKLEIERKKWEKEISKNKETVDYHDVAEVVSLMSGVPVTNVETDESDKLSNLNETISKLLIGQDEAVSKVVKSILRNRSGLKDPNRPIASILLTGQTGVGKTQLAKILAKTLFDSEENLIRVDMSEYGEKFSSSRMIGSPPGYVGYEEGGQLTEQVRRKPYSIVLLDEVEKAHPDIFNTFLQVLDEGHITDGLGRKIDFKNTIILMTSNVGVKKLKDFGSGMGFQTNSNLKSENEKGKEIIDKELKKYFAPEFLNRIDDVVIFNQLGKEDLVKIVDIELSGLNKRIEGLGYKLEVAPKAKEFLSEKGYDVQYGARPLKRAIQKYVEDPLSEMLISMKLKDGDIIRLSHRKNDQELTIKIK